MNATDSRHDNWAQGDRYEPYVGRWSRRVAAQFIPWLSLPGQAAWLDVGSGTGTLSGSICEMANPRSVKGIDRSAAYVQYARGHISDPRASFEQGDAQNLPVDSTAFDAAVSGLVLNFVPQPERMVAEMTRAVCARGVVALYVWDYAGRMEFMRYFWRAAIALDPAASALDEGRRFPICEPEALKELFENSNLSGVEVRAIDIDMRFKDFDDLWEPFLGGQGPAAGYAMSLSEEARGRLRQRLYDSMPFAVDGSIPLVARAWAARGRKQ